MTRTLIQFATPEYAAQMDATARTAARYFDRVIKHHPKNIADFVREHPRQFEFRRGFGFWVWKPLLLLRYLETAAPDDVVMYADSQCHFIADPAPLFELPALNDGIGLFHQRREGHKNSTWCTGEAFRAMGCDEPKYWDGDNLHAAFHVWRRTEKSLAFLRDWLKSCLDPRANSDDVFPTPNRPGFRTHRHDQSVLSLLAIRDGIRTYREPSQWGIGYPQPEHDYPQIIDHRRIVIAPHLRRPTMSSIIEVSTVGDCALKCSYCPQGKLGEAYAGPHVMDVDLFERCLDNTVPGDAIYFAGFVEPCLHPRFMDLLRIVLDRGHRCQLYTTARGLKVDAAREVAADKRIEKIVLHLPDAGGNLSHSDGSVPSLEALAGHPGAECMAMGNVPHSAVHHLWDRLPQRRGAMISRAGNLPLVQFTSRRGPIKCGPAPALDHPVLLPDGRLSLCCCDYSLTRIVGDLSVTPLSEILRGPAIQRIMDSQRAGTESLCSQCENAAAA